MSEVWEYVYMSVFTFWSALIIPWFIVRRRYDPLATRLWQGALFSAVSGVVLTVLLCVYGETFVVQNVSCFFAAFPGMAFVPFWWGPYCVRFFVLYYKTREQNAFLAGISEDSKDRQFLLRNKWMLNYKLWIAVFAMFYLLSIVGLFVVVWGDPDDYVTMSGFFLSNGLLLGCYGRWSDVLLTQSIIGVVVTLVFVYLLYKVEDNFGFKVELRNLFAFSVPVVILYALQSFTNLFPQFPSHSWPVVMMFLGSIFSIFVPTLSSYSRFYSRSQNKYATLKISPEENLSEDSSGQNGKVNLRLISNHSILELVLRDPNLLKQFKQFAAKSWCIENVQFYEEITRFSLLSDEESVKQETIRIYNLYFDMAAPLLLNLDETVMNTIRANYEDDQFSLNIFNEAEQKVLQIILTDTLHKWRQTKEFLAAMRLSSVADRIDFETEGPSAALKRNQTLTRLRIKSLLGVEHIDLPTTPTPKIEQV